MNLSQLKKVVITDTLLANPDFSNEFEIHTAAGVIDYLLGATICHNGKPAAFFSHKTDSLLVQPQQCGD